MNCSICSLLRKVCKHAAFHGLTPFAFTLLSLSAQDLDLYVRSVAAEGRIRVVAREAEWVPRLSVWSERSLERLEEQWRIGFRFQTGFPLDLRIEVQQETLRLGQVLRDRSLRQIIRIQVPPEEVPALELAETFVEAMLTRIRWAGGGLEEGRVTPPTVSWRTGAAAGLVAGESRRLADMALERFTLLPPPFPELVRPDDEVGSFLLYRWMRDTLLTDRETAATFWRTFARQPVFTASDWIEVTPDVTTLRELHVQWSVWWAAERRMLISEFRLTDAAREWLLHELNPVPRFFGLDSPEADPDVPTAFPDFEPYLKHPAMESALIQWMYRLQTVRFRQPAEFDAGVQQFEAALREAVEASGSKGKSRRWAEAVKAWEDSLRNL